MVYLAVVASYFRLVGDKMMDLADWLERYVGSWANPIYDAGKKCNLASQWLDYADDWVTQIGTSATNALLDASYAIRKANDLENWRDSISSLIDWTQNLRANFYARARAQVSDLFSDVNYLYSNFSRMARNALSDVISSVDDLVTNFTSKAQEAVWSWLWKVDSLWDDFSQKVLDTLGTDWMDLVSLIRNFPSSVTDPVHDLISDWLTEKKELVYGFVTEKIEDLWSQIQAKIDEKIEEQAEWWFGLAERVLDHVF
jgi:hypothetical protein